MTTIRFRLGALAICVLGIIGCVIGALHFGWSAFAQSWLCSYVFWLGIPLASVALVLVHDLSGGEWMAAARQPSTLRR